MNACGSPLRARGTRCRAHPARIVLAIVVVLAPLTACERANAPPVAPAVTSPPPVALSRVTPETLEWSAPVRATGRLEADKVTRIGPRVDGIIEAVFVDVGDRVSEGDPLLRTRQVDYRLAVQRAEAELAAAEAEAAEAARELARARTLHEQGVLSKSRLEAVETGHAAAEARRRAARAAVATARQALADTLVRAPYDAVVTGRYVDEGTYLRTMMSANSIVLELMKVDVVDAVVHVPETELAGIALGTPATLEVPGAGREVEGRVHALGQHADPATHNVEVRVRVDNPDGALRPGLFVRAELHPAPRSLLALDRHAVVGEGASRWVFVEQDGRALRRAVEVRELDARRVEVIAGLAPGDVVLAGPALATLAEGAALAPDVRAEAERHVAP